MSLPVYSRIKYSFIVLLFLLLIVLFVLICINIFGMAFKKLGFPPEYSIYFLFLSLLGSYVNLPLMKIKSLVPVIPSRVIDFYYTGYAVSSHNVEMCTSISLNLGGAVIPVIISIFLSTMVSLVDVLIGILLITILVHKIAKPVKGSGMAIHSFLPSILAALTALTISPQNAPIIAYISGTFGCLIGIDILNLEKIPDMGVPAVSIGGAGTFDAIFLTGIISVLLA